MMEICFTDVVKFAAANKLKILLLELLPRR